MTFRRLWFGCWSAHGDVVWTHDVLTCSQCGTVIPVLPQAIVRGPKHHPDAVRGKPITKVMTASHKVTPIKRGAA